MKCAQDVENHVFYTLTRLENGTYVEEEDMENEDNQAPDKFNFRDVADSTDSFFKLSKIGKCSSYAIDQEIACRRSDALVPGMIESKKFYMICLNACHLKAN